MTWCVADVVQEQRASLQEDNAQLRAELDDVYQRSIKQQQSSLSPQK